MKQHLKYALIIVLLVSLLFVSGAFADVGGICAAGVDHFNHNYTLTGDGPADMVAVALKQVGLTQPQLGYTGGWCAAFINDCAFLAGQQEAIPFVSNASGTTHVCSVLKQQVIAHGGREIAGTPQAGDLVFYGDSHVGLMIDSVNSIHGNHWPNNQPSQVWKGKYTDVNVGQTISIVRPNYKNTSLRGEEMTQGYNRVLPDGDYMIVTAGHEKKAEFFYLDINGRELPATSKSNVILMGPETNDAVPADIWTLTYDPGSKFYTIKQRGAEIALEIGEGDVERNKYQGANVRVCTANGTVAQQWAITHNAKNGYLVQAACSGMALDIAGGSVVAGANIQQSSYVGTDTQSWLFIPYRPAQTLANGRYTIVSEVDSSYGFYVPGGSGVSENQNVQIWKTASLDNQYNTFDITKLDNGYYKIIHVASGKALEVYGGGSTIGEKDQVTLHEWNGTNPQQWAIMKNGYNGGYTLWCRSSGYLIDLRRRETGNEKPLRQYTWNPNEEGGSIVSNALTWRFVPATTVSGELVLPSNLRAIEAEAFAGITASTVRIPTGCTSIGSGAFRNCANLRAVYIPATVSYIADNAFGGCTNVVIYGKSGSAAIQYANRIGLQYALY